jgi:hypothetical protein
MNNNCISARFRMKRFKDDMSGISTNSTIVFTQSLGVFAQSSKLWAQPTKKSIQSSNVFS